MNIIVALRVTLGMSVLAGAAVSGNAMAQTCDSSSGSVPPVNTYSDPSEYYCNYPYYWLTEGPGVAFVAQDESNSTVAGTVGLMGTSLYNTGVYGLSFFGDGNGVIGLGCGSIAAA